MRLFGGVNGRADLARETPIVILNWSVIKSVGCLVHKMQFSDADNTREWMLPSNIKQGPRKRYLLG